VSSRIQSTPVMRRSRGATSAHSRLKPNLVPGRCAGSWLRRLDAELVPSSTGA